MELPPPEAVLPHRPPFLFVDRIVELTPTKIIGVRTFPFHHPSDDENSAWIDTPSGGSSQAVTEKAKSTGTVPGPDHVRWWSMRAESRRGVGLSR